MNATLLVPTVQSVMSSAVSVSANPMSLGVNVTSAHLAHMGLDPMDVSLATVTCRDHMMSFATHPMDSVLAGKTRMVRSAISASVVSSTFPIAEGVSAMAMLTSVNKLLETVFSAEILPQEIVVKYV